MKIGSINDALLILGIRGEATRDDVKGAYKELLKLYHPDENPSKKTAWQYYDIRDAYDYLMEIFSDERIKTVGEVPYYNRSSGNGSVLKKSEAKPDPQSKKGGRIIGDAAAAKEMKEKQSQRAKATKKDIEFRERKKAQEELEKRRAEAAFQDAMEKINRIRFAERSAEIISAMMRNGGDKE